MNLYGYADGDPINNSDPFGLCAAVCKAHRLIETAKRIANGLAEFASNVGQGMAVISSGGGSCDGPGCATGAMLGLIGFASGTARPTMGSSMGTRYMGAGEAAVVAETRVIPAVNQAGRPRAIHYTTDAPMSSASATAQRYHLTETPTHACSFPLCNVKNSVAPEGTIAPGATQAATSQPINGAARPVPLKPE
jgi:hypothetical protein